MGLESQFFFGLIIPFLRGYSFKLVTLWIGIPFLIIGIISPQLLFCTYKGWMKLGYYFGWINSRIILGIVFILILKPISITMKFFGYNSLRIKKTNKNTYREQKLDQRINLKKLF